MKKYKFKILANKIGAIGKRLNYSATIEAENFDKAHLALYDTYEHIRILSVNGKQPDKDYSLKEFN